MKTRWKRTVRYLLAATVLAVLATVCFACGSSSASNGTENDGTDNTPPPAFAWQYKDLPTGGVEIFSTTSRAVDTRLTVPATVEGKKVKAVAEKGLKGFANVREITFEDGCEIVSIGSQAFAGCTALQTFGVPDTVERLGDKVFADCTSLIYVEIPVSVDVVGKNLFMGCDKNKLDVYCEAVARPSGWSDYYASNSTSNSSVYFTVWLGARQAEYSLENYRACVDIDGTVSITHYDGKEYDLVIPDTIGGRKVSTLCSGSFAGCATVRNITFPTELKKVASRVFSGCSLLETVSLPDTVESLGDRVFENCTSLIYAEIPLGVDTVGKNLFMGCNQSKLDVYCAAESKPSGWSDYYASNSTSNSSVYFNIWWGMRAAEYSLKNYRAGVLTDGTVAITHYDGKEYDLIVPDTIGGKNVTKIMRRAFSACSTIQTIKLPERLTYVGPYAFAKCLLLQSVTLPEDVTYVGYYAFTECTALTSVYLPRAVQTVGEYPFFGCDAKKLTIYCGAASKPSGWDDHYGSNKQLNVGVHFTFVWNADSV